MQTRPYRDAHAGTLRREDVGRQVRLAGWVNARRDHGGVVFVDLRDASGIAQVVFNPGNGAADEAVVNRLRGEFCISLVGTVRDRAEGTVNPDLATGDIEVAHGSVPLASTGGLFHASAALLEPFSSTGISFVANMRAMHALDPDLLLKDKRGKVHRKLA